MGTGHLAKTRLQHPTQQEAWTGSGSAALRKGPTFKVKLSRFAERLDIVRERQEIKVDPRSVEEEPEDGHSLLKEIYAEGQ